MIAYLKGTVLEKGKGFVIVVVGDPSTALGTGIGYRISLPERTLAPMEKGQVVRLYTHQVVREDLQELYGFDSMKELEFFWKLTAVSGVGPKMALHLLSLGLVDSVSKAIEKGDIEYLTGAQGVGKKTAQRVVLELKGKLVGAGEVSGPSSETISALENLGYPRSRAREVVAALPADASTEEKIRMALRQLSK